MQGETMKLIKYNSPRLTSLLVCGQMVLPN